MAKTWKCFLVPSPSHKHNPHPDNCGPPNATIWEEFIVYFFNWSYSPVKSLSRVWLFATPWTVHQPPGSSVPGIFQARILEWVAISFSRNWTQVFCITGGFFTVWATREGAAAAKSLQSCPTLCSPRDGSLPGSPGKNTGVGCHFLLQCMRMKSESKVAESCPTSRSHGLQPTRLLHSWDFPSKNTGVGCHL